MKKLWANDASETEAASIIERFTAGNDKAFDLLLAPFDVQGSLAHAQMLTSVGLLSPEEWDAVKKGLEDIADEIAAGEFVIEDGVEDVHSQVELLLTRRIGDAGKKLHSGRSRNDQILLDIKLYLRHELQKIGNRARDFALLMLKLSEKHKGQLLPGYTHFQLAMPSSFGLWFAAWAESIADDLELLHSAWRLCNRNPLGSAAGFGSSFPLNRDLTTSLLDFQGLNVNVVYAQMTRGKTEKTTAMALSVLAATLAKLSADVCLYMNQQFRFLSFPAELTTGSSIMPHKKNPDVFELIRARCNRIQSVPNELSLLSANLPSGYHRDFQLSKECLFPALSSIYECLEMCIFMFQSVQIRENILDHPDFDMLFSVERVNELVLSGTPFRDAYRLVAAEIEAGQFRRPARLNHTLKGSLGNLCNNEIEERLKGFRFN